MRTGLKQNLSHMRACEVAVVGGGPAGSTTALRLARLGRAVCLIEASQFDRPRYGETVPPEINPLLRDLQVWDAFLRDAHLPSPGTVSIWGSPRRSKSDFVTNPHGCGWHLDRARFDDMLCRAAEASGVKVIRQARVARSVRTFSSGWEVTIATESSRLCVAASVVVDATGLTGVSLHGSPKRDEDDRLLAIALRLSRETKDAADLRTYIESTPHGWWYSAPVPQGEMIAMFFTDPEIYLNGGVSLGPLLDLSPLTRTRFERNRICDSRVIYAPSALRNPMAGDGWLAVGDSAASYDPLSGRGIHNAVRHGIAAANAVHSWLGDDSTGMERYAAGVASDFCDYAVLRREYYAQELRFAEEGFWQRRTKQRNDSGD